MSGAVGRPASDLQVLRALVGMELRMARRRGENILVTIVIPAVVLVFFSAVSIAPGADRPTVDFLLPGTIALAIIATSLVNLGIATAFERSYGVMKRLGGAPVGGGRIVASKIVAVGIIELIQLVLLVSIAYLGLGWRPQETIEPAIIAVGFALGTMAFAGLGLALAGALRAEATLAIANGLFLGFVLLGGIVVPATDLPGILASLAAILPAAALSGIMRAGFDGGVDIAYALSVLAGWAVIGAAAAIRFFRWD